MKATAFVVVGLLVGCGSSPKTQPLPKPDTAASDATKTAVKPAAAKSLHDRLGGLAAIGVVVEEFVNRTAADPRIKERFFNTDVPQLKKQLTEFVCVATGGSCKYTGRDMITLHAGMDITDDEFTALVEDLAGALDKYKVPDKERGELLGALGPLKPQMVVAAGKLQPIDDKKLEAVTKLAAAQKDPAVKALLDMAAIAGKRGQRSYAEQLFTRAEMITGARPLAALAPTFRGGAPTRITTALKKLPADTAAQPVIGAVEPDEVKPPEKIGSLRGTLKIDGKAPSGLGVVMLTPAKGGKKRTPKQRIVEQRGREFAPHVMAVPVGSTVSFPNFDPIFHNVFSVSKPKAFDLGMYKSGDAREMKFDKPGIVRLGCNLHASMSAYLIVVDAPHYVVVDKDGAFAFDKLAPGKYTVAAWNEGAGDPATSELEIKEGANEQALDLKAVAAGISPDKFGLPRQ